MVSSKHILAQGPVIAGLARAAAQAALQKRRQNGHAPAPPTVPGAWLDATLPPRPPALVRDYIRHVGGDPGWYKGRLPPSLFPQWGFPLATRTLEGLAYPLAKVMNAGCRIEVNAPLPDDEPLLVRARLESIDDDGRRAILTQRVITGTASAREALIADMRVFVPLAKKKEDGPRKPPTTVPADAKEIAFFRLRPDAGLDFAKLTGDFNPVHWVPAYARASGFRACILHGFSTLARAIEALDRRVFAGDVGQLVSIDVRNTAPLVLPAQVGVYVDGAGGVWVGDAPSGRAYLEGRYLTKESVHV
jgi:acyl dehydratase